MYTIETVKCDITTLEVDAIVNAANSSLLGGGGVDGAIHRAAGPDLLKECRTLGGAKTGEVKVTKAYNLPSKYVFHAVGPIWNGGKEKEEEGLKSCYENALNLCLKENVRSIAFSSISCGIYGFPYERACEISFNTIKNNIVKINSLEKVIFCCFEDKIYNAYQKLIC
jgi:O-acetyl-ADP-ribose deacetylase